MLPFRKILFPIDYSEPCRAVVPYVKEMSRHFSAAITLVHACGLGLEALEHSELTPADPRWQSEWRAFEQGRIRDFAAEMFPAEHVESFAEEGDAPTLIHKVVQHQGADLVMLPTHGHGPVRRFLLGSVTAKLLHDLTTVVWTGVNSTLAEHQAAIPYKSIVCALDNSDDAELFSGQRPRLRIVIGPNYRCSIWWKLLLQLGTSILCRTRRILWIRPTTGFGS